MCDIELITAGLEKDCASIRGSVGAHRDLILVNYEHFNRQATLLATNIEGDSDNSNEDGLTNIELLNGATQHTFEGTDYSVVPSHATELREDGNPWFTHSIQFIAYSKSSVARKVLEDLGGSRVIAITRDKSTGLFELFGLEQGLKISALERTYIGTQTSNSYMVTLSTPDIAGVKEWALPKLATAVVTASS